MVNRTIKVYARLKKTDGTNVNYKITQNWDQSESLILHGVKANVHKDFRICNRQFRFEKIFDQNSEQSEIFKIVAIPVINSVLEGFNGTIFAYGQTGSGKTYTITGSAKNYNDRGIIPRTIEYIFEHNEKLFTKPTLYISYMEIYNEAGYDLLGAKQCSIYLEELPKIMTLDNGRGETHVRNLSVLPINTKQEAMRLLFLGDTNRTIAETPMNEYSSRSHCIFTIYVTLRDCLTNRVRYSKLNIVDLAGSERVYKTLSTGMALNEAKYINLSLHHLQQVIIALSKTNKCHIPYRNSLITHLLRDSLGGNCLTSMLATLTLKITNIGETVATCKFTQTVSLVKTIPIINETNDTQQEVLYLTNKIRELETLLSQKSKLFNSGSSLDKLQQNQCRQEVQDFLKEKCPLNVDQNIKKVEFYFELLRDAVKEQKRLYEEQLVKNDEILSELDELKKDFNLKEKEMVNIERCLDLDEPRANSTSDGFNFVMLNSDEKVLTIEEEVTTPNEEFIYNLENDQSYRMFLTESGIAEDLCYYKKTLNNKYEMAKLFTEVIEQCQRNISYIKLNINNAKNMDKRHELLKSLEEQQKIYKKSLDEIKHVKSETLHLESNLKQVKVRATKKFKTWLEKRQHFNQNNFNDKSIAGNYVQRSFLDDVRDNEENCCFGGTQNGFSVNVPPSTTKNCYCGCSDDVEKSLLTELPEDEQHYNMIDSVPTKEIFKSPEICHNVVLQTNFNDENNDESKERFIDKKISPTSFFEETDNMEFREFMSTVTLTGEEEIDREIFEFYRSKFVNVK